MRSDEERLSTTFRPDSAHIVLTSDQRLFPIRSLCATSGKPSTWLPLGRLVEQVFQKISKVHTTMHMLRISLHHSVARNEATDMAGTYSDCLLPDLTRYIHGARSLQTANEKFKFKGRPTMHNYYGSVRWPSDSHRYSSSRTSHSVLALRVITLRQQAIRNLVYESLGAGGKPSTW